MERGQIHVFPTIDLRSRPEVERAARTALFGPNMKVFSGGWSHHDRDALKKLPISPVRVVSAEAAEDIGTQFFVDAEERWAKTGQLTKLLPLERAFFRLVRVESQQIWSKRRPLAWKLTWVVFADAGAGADRPQAQTVSFVPIDMAELTLTISLTGRVVGGSATWRPTGRPMSVDQHVRPDPLLETLAVQRAQSHVAHGGNTGDHADEACAQAVGQDPEISPFFELRYTAGPRHMACNFIDPRLHFIEPGNMHGPGLVIPVSEYGLNAQILTFGSRAPGGETSEITVAPWVTGCFGTVPMTAPPAGHRAHWAVVDLLDEQVNEEPRFYEGGAPLKLSGLAHVSFTVHNELGCVAHAYEDVCGSLESSDLPMHDDGPETAQEASV